MPNAPPVRKHDERWDEWSACCKDSQGEEPQP